MTVTRVKITRNGAAREESNWSAAKLTALQPSKVVSDMRMLCIGVLLVLLTVPAFCEDVYFQGADSTWHSLEASPQDGRIQIQLDAAMIAAGQTFIVLGKPEWMVLEDDTPPHLTGLAVDGRSIELQEGDEIVLGAIDGDSARVAIGLSDESNPIAADVYLQIDELADGQVRLDTSELGPPNKSGDLIAELSGLPIGGYRGTLRVRDLSPMSNSATWPVSFSVMGIAVADDGQSVTLANSSGGFTFEPGLSRQIKLPTEQQLYLTGTLKGWVYPRELDDVQIIEDSPTRKTVLITSTTLEDNKREPVEGSPARIEYELTVRSDSPALFVTSRLYNISGDTAKGDAFWGWLGGEYFATPTESKIEWEGVARDTYVDVGNVGWVWIAPRSEARPGLVWMADGKFVQSRFDTMLLRSSARDLAVDECVEASFAIAPANTPEDAERIFQDIRARDLLPGLPVE